MMKLKWQFVYQSVVMGLIMSCVLFSGVASAGDIRWNGYLNAIVSVSDSKTPYLESIDENIDYSGVGFGVSAAAKINSKISVAGQFHSSTEGVEFDWGYAQYYFSESLVAKAGRLKYSAGLYTETVDIGAVYYWVRPPESVYSESAELVFENYNGGLLSFTTGDDVEFTTEIYTGEIIEEDEQHKKMLGVVFIAESEIIMAKVAVNTATLLTATGNPDNDKTKLFVNFGIQANLEIATIIFEFAQTDVEDNTGLDKSGWFVTLARTMDSWTPHFTYQSFETVTNGPEQTSFTLGLNKQLDPSVVVKMELQQVDPTNGGLFDAQPTDSSVTLVNLSMNMVF